MEITVRSGPAPSDSDAGTRYAAAATFLQPGQLALKRIPLSPRSDSYKAVMRTLVEGFKVTPASHAKDSVEFRVLTALTHATGVVDLDA